MAKTSTKKEERELLIGFCVVLSTVLLLLIMAVAVGQIAAILRRPATQPPSSTAPTLIHNPFGAQDFVMENGYITCPAGNSVLGVDVSEYQGSIDWPTVAAQNIGFAMIRIGGRGWGAQGTLYADVCWQQNLEGARAAGLQVGVYFYSQAISVEEAEEEAAFVLELLQGQALDLPVVFDWEFAPSEDGRTHGMSPKTLEQCVLAFCEKIRSAGYQPMVYFNQELGWRMLDLLQLQQQGYGFWLAMYSGAMTYPYRVDLWQYTSAGTVPGIPAAVDLNLWFRYDT